MEPRDGIMQAFAWATAPLRWIERARGRRRLGLLVLYGLGVALAALLARRWTSLNGLPDLGDPFDVEAFQAPRVPDSQNAWTYYERALERLDDRALEHLSSDLHAARKGDWATSSPELGAWVDANRDALDQWRLASERPDARPPWLDASGDA